MAKTNPLTLESQSLGLQYMEIDGYVVRVVHIEVGGPVTYNSKSIHSSAPHSIVLFFHGINGRIGQFKHQMHYLAQRGYCCIGIDLPGHGESYFFNTNAPKSVYLNQAILLYVRAFEKFCVQNPKVYLVGHSYGALTALCFYHTLKSQYKTLFDSCSIQGLCLIGFNAKPYITWYNRLFLLMPKFIVVAICAIFGGLMQKLFFSRKTMKELPFLVKQEHTISKRYKLDALLKMFREEYLGNTAKALYAAISSYKAEKAPPKILIVYGEEDALFNAKEHYEKFRDDATCDNTKDCISAIFIPEAGHNVMLENPIAVNKLLSKFVSS